MGSRLNQLAQKLDQAGDNRTAQILNQLWDILVTAMEQLYDVLGETAWDSDNFTRLFKLLLSQYDVGTIPPVLDAVAMGPVSAMRCQQCKHLIVLGAAEGSMPGYGNLPRYSGSAGVLTDQERHALRDIGVPLTGGALEGLQTEFAEIYGVFCGAEESVTISCSAAQPALAAKPASAARTCRNASMPSTSPSTRTPSPTTPQAQASRAASASAPQLSPPAVFAKAIWISLHSASWTPSMTPKAAAIASSQQSRSSSQPIPSTAKANNSPLSGTGSAMRIRCFFSRQKKSINLKNVLAIAAEMCYI